MSALGIDFRVVAFPLNNLEIEEDPEEVRVEIVENNIGSIELEVDEDRSKDDLSSFLRADDCRPFLTVLRSFD
ncbi:hypothetical protein YK56LOC_68100 [Caballeronia sp. HLA56]